MANLQGDIKKLQRGELIGKIAIIFCAAVLVYFIACFTVSSVTDNGTLQLVTLITSPVLLVAGVGVAAFCNLKYGAEMDKIIRQYILDICVENAKLLHPERKSLTFYIAVEQTSIDMQVNGYNEKIIFDFSDLGKFTFAKKLGALNEIKLRLCATFCKLYERGGEYTDVAFSDRNGRKKGKAVFIIKDGVPDSKAYKQYLKSKK